MCNLHAMRYLWELRWRMPNNIPQRKQILSRMETLVRDFTSEEAHADYSAIAAHFGTPKQIVISCLEEMDGTELAIELSIRKKIVAVVISVAAIALVLWASVVFLAWEKHQKNDNGFFTENIVEEYDITDCSKK